MLSFFVPVFLTDFFFFLPCSNQVTWRPKDLGPHSFPEASGLIQVEAERGRATSPPRLPVGQSPERLLFRAPLLSISQTDTQWSTETITESGQEGRAGIYLQIRRQPVLPAPRRFPAWPLRWDGRVRSPRYLSPHPLPGLLLVHPAPYGAHQLIPHSRKPRNLATGWERTRLESPS